MQERHNAMIIEKYLEIKPRQEIEKYDYDNIIKIEIDKPILKEGDSIFLTKDNKELKIEAVHSTDVENTIMYKCSPINYKMREVESDEYKELLKERQEIENIGKQFGCKYYDYRYEKRIKKILDLKKGIRLIDIRNGSYYVIQEIEFYKAHFQKIQEFVGVELVLDEENGSLFYKDDIYFGEVGKLRDQVRKLELNNLELKNIEERYNKLKNHWLIRLIDRNFVKSKK